ncbi:Rv3654c family TadE-like protein [Terracoccus sp. 273MFTsu3.1]|uniref:Rv3654c family TadE-like protein n=1 Tax=Terracoccus sp. 273MFTsu3.1 TaxID=1172188 RepID=UPI00036C8B13|nr:Rv3654c family TadE-like protein [Terracoccus sp. 273MFTsu3.1]
MTTRHDRPSRRPVPPFEVLHTQLTQTWRTTHARPSVPTGPFAPRVPVGPTRPKGERGAASILALSVVAMVLVLTMGALVLASVVVASHRARVAADLGSLAAASAMQDGADSAKACAVAQQVARANGAATQSCSSMGADVELAVTVRARLWPEPATARARAGPRR